MHPTSIDPADVKIKIRIPIDLKGWRHTAAIHTGYKGYVVYWQDETGMTWYLTKEKYWIHQDEWEDQDALLLSKAEIHFEARQKAEYALSKAKMPPTYLGFVR